jgi:hypothetical protein
MATSESVNHMELLPFRLLKPVDLPVRAGRLSREPLVEEGYRECPGVPNL